jgi:hypothetical protein
MEKMADKQDLADVRATYVAPRVVKISDMKRGAGLCTSNGSGDIGYCNNNGNSAFGDGCGLGNSADHCSTGNGVLTGP